MSHELRVALGNQGLSLTLPGGVACSAPRPLQDFPPAGKEHHEELLRAALHAPVSGPSLSELAAGRRRAVVLVGDLTFPTPYPLLLPELCRNLETLGIRPTRIAFLCCPGAPGPVLGRLAIRSYGSDTVGEHELRAWNWGPTGPEERDSLFDAADLKLAIFPTLPDTLAALPSSAALDLAIAVSPQAGLVSAAAKIISGPSKALFAVPRREALQSQCAVCLTTGGGAPADSTLEEALTGFRPGTACGDCAATTTRVLVFSGDQGLGSARFTLDLWWLLDWFDKRRPSSTELPQEPPFLGPWNPLQALALHLNGEGRIVFFAPAFSEHDEGEDLREHLAQAPSLAERLVLVNSPEELWAKLEAWHGARYTLLAEPLGWRGACS